MECPINDAVVLVDELEEDGGDVMPLMEATRLWQTLRDTVADEEEHNSITALLHVQVPPWDASQCSSPRL